MKKTISLRSGLPPLRATVSTFMVLVLTLTLGTALAPRPALAQADLTVVHFIVNPPSGQPGGEVYIDFTIQNVGVAPTALSAILNYIFIWDTLHNIPVMQLMPDAEGNVHTLRSLLPGETDAFTGVPVTIPADMQLDTNIVFALITDYPDLEPETDELNNFATTTANIEPLLIPFSETPYSVGGNIDLAFYSDVFRFPGGAGEIVYSEGIAAELGSVLDPQVNLLGPHPDTLLTPEGNITIIDPDSRLTNLGLPSVDEYRIDLYGEMGSTGMYELRLQRGIPETEPNDDPSVPEPLYYGEARAGSFDYPGDIDWYSFMAGAGDIVLIDVDASEAFLPPPDSTLDPIGVVVGPLGDTLVMDDDSHDMDPYLFFITPDAGEYKLALEGAPGGGLGGGYPGYFYAFRIRQILGVQKPDLVIYNLQPLPGAVPAADTAQVFFETWNIGGLTTFEGGVSIDVVLSVDAVIDAGDQLLEVGDFVGDIDPGNFHPTGIDVRIPWNTLPGSYYLGIVLDSTGDEVEENETNNTALLPLIVDPYADSGEPGLFPEEISLFSYPNPSAGRTMISYDLPARGSGDTASWKVEISVYNVAGQRVANLVDRAIPAGRHQVVWDGRVNGRQLPSGVYFCRMRAGNVERSLRIVLVR